MLHSMNSIWWHIAETGRNNMKKDVSQNRLHHELQLPSLWVCSSTPIHVPMFPTQIMWFCPFYFSVWKISRQLEARSRWKSLGTCCSQQQEYVLGADSWWGASGEILLGDMLLTWSQAPSFLGRKSSAPPVSALLHPSSRLNLFFFLKVECILVFFPILS